MRCAFFLVCALMLGACQRSDPNAAFFKEPLTPGRAERDRQDNLILHLANGQQAVFGGELARGCIEGCRAYHLSADMPERHFYVVSHNSMFDRSSFILIDDRSGAETEVGAGVPVFASGSDVFAVLSVRTENTLGDLTVWRRRGDGAVREWIYSRDKNSTLEDFVLGVFEKRVLRWQSADAFTLDLSTPARNGKSASAYKARVMRDGTGWKLVRESQ